MCGVQTNVITSAIVSPRGDSTQFEALLDRTVANDFDVQEAYVDKGYLTHTHLATVHDIGGKLYVPFKKNSSGKTGDTLWDSLFHLYSYNREAFQSHYGRRQNVEATFSGIKRKFGPAVRSRSPVAQRNEVYVKVLCWNLSMLVHSIFELGIEAEFWKGRR
jgi:transposase